ncbi:hypothetical protein DLJ53_12565 [Acuticoccus sediminis]|uniref:TRAP transporter small permease protein n=1 Tax=Acuticoccus sediminis TaxID=2184697 RepID=A0A8B2NWL6_9HYPH|nr:TRAP transporter small permease subunit [Acuticoccus sediminis]RAI02193.1 hypothetical protein DLJ53_12565 [Acuticoccus sediminis]
MRLLDRAIRLVDALIALLGRCAAFTVIGIIATILIEMIARGGFSRSQPWANDVTAWLLAALIFLGGPWALATGNFVRVDALYDRFSARTRAWIDTVISTALFALFCGTLLKFGWTFFARAYSVGETSANGNWGGPVWVAKGLLPLGAVLLILAWISHLYHAWRGDRDETREEGL